MNSLPKIVTQQRRGCDLNPGPSAPESSMLAIRLPSHPDDNQKNRPLTSLHLEFINPPEERDPARFISSNRCK